MNLDNITDISRKDVLGALGLAPRLRDYIWPALGVFSTGVLLGAGAALLFTPKSGAKLRKEIRGEFRSWVDEVERKLGIKSSNDTSKKADRQGEQGEHGEQAEQDESQRESRAA